MAIRLYWWQEKRIDRKENYGDLLSKYLVGIISKKKVITVSHPSKRLYKYFLDHYISIGSIISSANKNSIVWGSGIIKRDDFIGNAKFSAVRGPKTRARIIEMGFECPEIYGDPSLLLPKYYTSNPEKKYPVGIIPHYVDYLEVKKHFKNNKTVKVIDLLTHNVEKTTDEILECQQIISSSLHGVIVSQAYKIPALWIKLSDQLFGDNIKFYDYYESVGINFKNEIFIEPKDLTVSLMEKKLMENKTVLFADDNLLKVRQKELILSCPFKA